MQKISNVSSLFSICVRGGIFGFVALCVFVAGLWALKVIAVSDCAFCDILNKILISKNWEDSDGTVVNAQALGWLDASHFVQHMGEAQKCPHEHQCIIGLTSSGQILCNE